MATHAAALQDHDIIIVSKARKSFMKGAQYLHRPIPLPQPVATPPFKITYDLVGTVEEYRNKVYSDNWDAGKQEFDGGLFDGRVSPEDLVGQHDAWDIRTAYNWLWHAYGSYVKDKDFKNATDIDEVIQWAGADIVISTVPATLLCLEGHSFMAEKIFSTDQAMFPLEQNWVVCNGRPEPHWYRAARIQDYDTVEWPWGVRPPVTPLWEVIKPTRTNCTCFPDIHRMGRYGKWTKGVLSDSAFYDTVDLLANWQERLF
jgi:hypothetical protein